MFAIFRRLRARIKYRHFESDLQQELEAHRVLKQEELEAGGMPAAEAAPASRRALGNTTYMREESRAIWVARWVESLWQDARYGAAALRRQPMFGVGAVLMLGLGLGLVTTVFTVADASFFRPWRVPDPETLFYVRSAAAPGSDFAGMSVPEHRYHREHSRSFRQLALTVRGARIGLFDGANVVDRVGSMTVTANYFELLGVPIIAGRSFIHGEDTTPQPSSIVISERLWTERFSRAPSTIGRTVRLDSGRPQTIVGVAAGTFLDGHSSRTEVWRLFSFSEYEDPRHRQFPHAILGRLAEGVTESQAIAELGQLSAAYRSSQGLPPITFRLVDTRPSINGERLAVVGLVFAALVMVQLVACANVGNLLLARAIARQREIAVRLSLGAGRWRIVRQLVTETAVLSVLAGALGLAIAVGVPITVVALFPDPFEAAAFYAPTAKTFAFVFGMSLLTALACSLTPALRATRVSVVSLAAERHGHTAGTARLRRALLAVQIALAVLLLTSAGLLTRAIEHASGANPGFDVGAFQEVEVDFPPSSQQQKRQSFYQRVSDITRTGNWPPLTFSESPPVIDDRFSIFLRLAPAAPVRVIARRNVAPNYFDVLGIGLLAGRTVDRRDEREIVLSRHAAEMFWPGESPVGKTLISGIESRDFKSHVVVGIAPDLPVRSLGTTDPVAYTQTPYFVDRMLVRSTDASVIDRLRETVRIVDPAVTISARPLREMLEDSLFIARTGSRVAWAIGAIGLLLATIGAFSLFTQAVAERRREIGIRMALGAQAAQVIALVLATTRRSIVSGLVLGGILAAASAQLLRSYLYGLSPFDPVAYLQIAVILFVAALLATWLPARRATRINPVETLKTE